MTEMSLPKTIIVTAEVCGTTLSEPAAEMMAMELAAYDRGWILGALKRCRMELKGRLTMAAILERIDDGRPGADEAFAMLPTAESQTVVWTDEMAAASSFRDISADNMTQRLAFREAYIKAVAHARETRQPARWWVSIGHDVAAREQPIAAAVAAGRLELRQAQTYGVMLENKPAAQQIEHKGAPPSAEVRAKIAKLIGETFKRIE